MGGGEGAGGHQKCEGTQRDSRAVTAERTPGGCGARGRARADEPQMTVGTLPLLLLRLLFRDRLGVAMSTKRSSGQPYCSSTSMHSWLAACRA